VRLACLRRPRPLEGRGARLGRPGAPPRRRPRSGGGAGRAQAEGGARAWWARPDAAWGAGERLLACGAAAVADLRAAVHAELGYTTSAGAPAWPAPGAAWPGRRAAQHST